MGEPLTLRTGLPGHGKTLNTIKELDEQASKENKTIYFYNINGLKPESLNAEWVEFDTPQEWFNLPPNSIIVMDEAQKVFPNRKQGSQVPLSVSSFETVRHLGHEVHLITQDPKLIDFHLRKLVGCHVHYQRLLQSKRVARWVFPYVVNPRSTAEKKVGTYKIIKLDKKIFGAYTSASQHNFKIKIPFILKLMPVLILFIAYLLYSFFSRGSEAEKVNHAQVLTAEKPKEKGVIDTLLSTGKNTDRKKPKTVEEYLAERTPRLPNVPSSAPIYDELTQPKSYPRLSCVLTQSKTFIQANKKKIALGRKDGSVSGCICYTQQATMYKIEFNACVNIVENGYFDAAIPDSFMEASNGKDSFDRASKFTGASR